MTNAMREAARARGVKRWSTGSTPPTQLRETDRQGGQRERLEEIGGKPQSGEWTSSWGRKGRHGDRGGVRQGWTSRGRQLFEQAARSRGACAVRGPTSRPTTTGGRLSVCGWGAGE
jgi:hypothetical protein